MAVHWCPHRIANLCAKRAAAVGVVGSRGRYGVDSGTAEIGQAAHGFGLLADAEVRVQPRGPPRGPVFSQARLTIRLDSHRSAC
jgi:hypothetical protein